MLDLGGGSANAFEAELGDICAQSNADVRKAVAAANASLDIARINEQQLLDHDYQNLHSPDWDSAVVVPLEAVCAKTNSKIVETAHVRIWHLAAAQTNEDTTI